MHTKQRLSTNSSWIRIPLYRAVLATAILAGFSMQAMGQTSDLPSAPSTYVTEESAEPIITDTCGIGDPFACMNRVIVDQPIMVRSLFHMNRRELAVAAGIVGATAVTVHYDRSIANMLTMTNQANRLNHYADLGAIYAPFTAAGVGYFAGAIGGNQKLRETSIEAGEAMVDAALAGKVLKYAINRQGPGAGAVGGEFYAQNMPTGNSMPSGHALNIWAFTRAVTANYPSKKVAIPMYIFATGMSSFRVLSRAHYTSDVIIGSALGYGIGQSIVTARSGREHHIQIAGQISGQEKSIGITITH